MKKIFLVGLAAAMFASCSSDETLQVAQNNKAIGFSSFVNKSTRGAAHDITTANISNFSVYGFMESANGQIFDNEAVTGSGSEWTYGETQYWTAGKNYWFSAIAPTTDANWSYATNDVTTGGIITFDNTTGEQDLLYAYSGMVECKELSAMDKVGFTFNHLLSRVKFNFTNAMGNDNTTLKVTRVVIMDANNKATCNVSLNAATENSAANYTWTLAEDNVKGELAFTPNTENIANGSALATDHKYMIPRNQTYKLNFIVEMYQGEVLADVFTHEGVEIPAVDMKSGYSYMFSAELNSTNIDPEEELYPIEFTVTTVKEWEDFNDAGEGAIDIPLGTEETEDGNQNTDGSDPTVTPEDGQQ